MKIMSVKSSKSTEPERAAEVFYGQSETAFAEQVERICRNDTRLIAVFVRTRERYRVLRDGCAKQEA